MPDESVDFIVVGGGHNGLVAANYLARGGASVCVLEQRPYLGGMAASHAHIPAAPRHLLSKGAIDAVFIKTTGILDDLALAGQGLRLIPIDPGYGWLGDDGETLGIFSSAERTANDISRFSAADAKTYLDLQHAFSVMLNLQAPLFAKAATAIGPLDLAKAALRVIGDRESRRVLGRLASASAYEAIAASFGSDPLRSLFAYWTEIACPADIDGSGIYLASLSLIHRYGCSRPQGGMGGLIDALEQTLHRRGGNIAVGTEVERIVVEQGRASAVRLRDGRSIDARRGVLASCAPQRLYGQLLDARLIADNSRARLPFMPANSSNMCPFKLDMALSVRPQFGKAQALRTARDGLDVGATSWMTGSFADHLDHAAALRRGEMGRRPPIWMTVLSHADASLAPEQQGVAYLYSSAPMTPAAGWDHEGPRLAQALLMQAQQHLDGLQQEIGRCITTPADFERQYGTPRGCLYHVDMLPTRLALARPAVGMGGSRSEIAHLYLAGSGSHPGGGVFGMPGKLAAEAALIDTRG